MSATLFSGRRTLISAFSGPAQQARARSTLASPFVLRPTTARPAVSASGARMRSTLASPWVLKPSKPATTVNASSTRARSTLATPWVIKSSSGSTAGGKA